MCLYPKLIYREGKYKEDNYHGKKGEEYYITAFTKCGYCSQCQNEKANNWVIRNYYEEQKHKEKCFITLTYKDNPIFLIKEHAQKFIKRLRRYLEYHKITDNKIRYFACGEYGTLHHRPHIHIILYGWEEKKENLTFLEFNKKGNPIFKSEIIEKIWGYGRTTYQWFDSHEIPYITLYETPKLENAKGYLITKKHAKELLEKFKKMKENKNEHRGIILQKLEKYIKKIEREKLQYICIKEFNLWSLAVGWDIFIKKYIKGGYDKNGLYDFKEYIEDKEFATPTSWVKKMANNGDEFAIKEMLVRADELTSRGTAESLRVENNQRQLAKTIKEKKEWQTKKDNIIL